MINIPLYKIILGSPFYNPRKENPLMKSRQTPPHFNLKGVVFHIWSDGNRSEPRNQKMKSVCPDSLLKKWNGFRQRNVVSMTRNYDQAKC